jgi:regulator of nonsense transcripts 2
MYLLVSNTYSHILLVTTLLDVAQITKFYFQAILEEYFNELTQRREWKSSLRKCNLNVENRPEECDLHKLDSSLKKNTAFVRKIKNFTEAQKDAILKEMTSLNLTKYIGEVASGIVEAKLKMNDLPGIIEISSK